MSETSRNGLCACPCNHYMTIDGRCANTSLASEDPKLSRYTICGCCVADCPDVHAEDEPGLFTVTGPIVFAAEHVATLSEARQRDMYARAARGEFRIETREQMNDWPSRPAERGDAVE